MKSPTKSRNLFSPSFLQQMIAISSAFILDLSVACQASDAILDCRSNCLTYRPVNQLIRLSELPQNELYQRRQSQTFNQPPTQPAPPGTTSEPDSEIPQSMYADSNCEDPNRSQIPEVGEETTSYPRNHPLSPPFNKHVFPGSSLASTPTDLDSPLSPTGCNTPPGCYTFAGSEI